MAYTEDKIDEPASERGPRKGEGKMDAEEFRSLVASLIRESQSYALVLDTDRERSTDYFRGKPIGNEKDGRSKIIITEVRDKILGVMPDLMAMFFGQDRAVEYIPTSAAKVDAVDQISEFISKVVIETDNNGFMAYHAVLLDGLVRRLGGFKWYWDESSETKQYSQTGLTKDQIKLLLMEDGVELAEDGIEASDQKPGSDGQPLYDIEYKRTDKGGKVCLRPIPPEELIFLPSTRDPQTALFIGHQLEKTRGELIAIGVSEKDIDEHGSETSDSLLETDPLKLARQIMGVSGTDAVHAGEANNKILYVEGYGHLDFDGDGIAELRKVCTIGAGFWPVHNKPIDAVPFSVFCPIPEPHTLVGQSYADLTEDIQRIKSAVARGILDSLSTSIFPRTWFKENDANISDMMSTDIGAPIRTRTGAGAVGTFQHTFVGKDAFPLLSYFDQVSENRTGRSAGADGLDADALQSTTKSAADKAIAGSRSQTELVARIFAEMALKPMYRGIYKLMIQHPPRARMVRLREQWVEVDPRSWDSDLDVQVNVALGGSPKDAKLAVLLGFKATQEAYLEKLGPDNPIVGLGNLRYTIGKISELSGFPDSTKFFKPLPLDWKPPQQPPQPPPPDPNMAMVQVEAQKMQMEGQLKQQEMQMKLQEMMSEHQMRMQEITARHQNDSMKMQIDLSLRERDLAIKEFAASSKAGIDAQKANAEVDLMQAEADIMARKAHGDAHLAVADAAHQIHMDERKQTHAENPPPVPPAGGSQ